MVVPSSRLSPSMRAAVLRSLAQLREFASIHGLKIISVADLVRYAMAHELGDAPDT